MATNQLLTTIQLLEYLQISRDYLNQLIEQETLKIGKHYLDIRRAEGKYPVYRWKIAEVEKVFSTPPRERKK